MPSFLKYIISFIAGILVCFMITKLYKKSEHSIIENNIPLGSASFTSQEFEEYKAKLTATIPYENAQKYVTNYQYFVGNTNGTNPVQTQYLFLSIPEMSKMIWAFWKLGATGIRIYPGIYPKGKTLSKRKDDYHHPEDEENTTDVGSKITLVFTPTKGKQMPEDIPVPGNKEVGTYVAILGEDVLQNETTLCPPPNCNNFGAVLLQSLYTKPNGSQVTTLTIPRTDSGNIHP